MELLLTLSKHTHNSFSELMKLPFEYVYGLWNALIRVTNREREEAERERENNNSMPSAPAVNINSYMSQAKAMANSMKH
jgi:hypothetical protein